jgi:hypothetical protein
MNLYHFSLLCAHKSIVKHGYGQDGWFTGFVESTLQDTEIS